MCNRHRKEPGQDETRVEPNPICRQQHENEAGRREETEKLQLAPDWILDGCRLGLLLIYPATPTIIFELFKQTLSDWIIFFSNCQSSITKRSISANLNNSCLHNFREIISVWNWCHHLQSFQNGRQSARLWREELIVCKNLSPSGWPIAWFSQTTKEKSEKSPQFNKTIAKVLASDFFVGYSISSAVSAVLTPTPTSYLAALLPWAGGIFSQLLVSVCVCVCLIVIL